jgi:hypothetical protein
MNFGTLGFGSLTRSNTQYLRTCDGQTSKSLRDLRSLSILDLRSRFTLGFGTLELPTTFTNKPSRVLNSKHAKGLDQRSMRSHQWTVEIDSDLRGFSIQTKPHPRSSGVSNSKLQDLLTCVLDANDQDLLWASELRELCRLLQLHFKLSG